LAIVKVLEHLGVYNSMLEYGDRARGKVITVINRYAWHET
jgi:methylenetetrahydrofolate dehydrogenase (NAD+)